MFDKNIYLQAYQQKYNSRYKQGTRLSYQIIKNFLFAISFLSLPFIFTFFLSIFLLINKHDEQEYVFNKNNNFFDEIFYKNISKINFLDLKIKKPNSFFPSSFEHDDYDDYDSKFEEVVQDFKNNFSNETTSLKKISLPSDINDTYKKKKKFIDMILPLIIDQNKKILAQRQKLIDIKEYLIQNRTLSKEDQKQIKNLAFKYSIITKDKHKIDVINELLISVDIIPNSIVLAQAANESGWGTSRFAKKYNALFGQYTYDDKSGIIPSRRDKGKKHLIKYFTSINQSIESYFTNINSHPAYSKFRNLRKQLRYKKNIFNVELLSNELGVYALDKNYISTIKSIININKLKQYDKIKSLQTYL